MTSFDLDLHAMIFRKRSLAVRLKFAEQAMLLRYEELMIVRSAQETEDNLQMNVALNRQKLEQMQEKVDIIRISLKTIRAAYFYFRRVFL